MSSMCSRLFEKLCKHYLAEYLVCGDSCVSYCADWEPQLCRRRSSEDWKQNSKHGVKTELSTIELQERHVQEKSSLDNVFHQDSLPDEGDKTLQIKKTWVQEEELLSYDDDMPEPSFIASRPSSASRLFSTASRLRHFSTVSMIFCTAAGPFAAQGSSKVPARTLFLP